MSNRYWSPIVACVIATCLPFSTAVGAQKQPTVKSATLARDVNGFRLGMTIAEARSLAPLTFIGGDQFEVETAGFTYNFGVTPKGRIYRVQSTQQLNHFVADRQFIATLEQRLIEKYGKPSSHSGDTFHWALTERVTNDSGQTLPFTTMWMSAYIGGFGGDPTLEITIIDFRILWADQAAVNHKPRETAEKRIRF
ncbi:MAG: hypothetical protein KGM49_13945 [Sphingomonadales bacterium]|nr:hypothetical protein [Sphingomonadales bacterium]